MANTTSFAPLNSSMAKPFVCDNLQTFLDMDIRENLPNFYIITSLTACVFTFILCCFASFLNAIAVFVILRTPQLHQPRNILLCSLAACDFFVGLTSQPSFVVAEISLILGKMELYCLTVFIHFYTSWLFNGISFLTLSAISIERYLALRFHLRYTELITTTLVVITVVMYWLIWITCVTVLWFWAKNKLFTYVLIALCFLIGIIALRCFALIHKTVKRHKKHVQDTHQQTLQSMVRYRRTTNTMVILVTAFALSYFPFIITTTISAVLDKEDLRTSAANCLAVAIMFANSTANPLIYFWRVTEFREATKRTLKKFLPLKEKQTDAELDTYF